MHKCSCTDGNIYFKIDSITLKSGHMTFHSYIDFAFTFNVYLQNSSQLNYPQMAMYLNVLQHLKTLHTNSL